MNEEKVRQVLSSATFLVVNSFTNAYNRFDLPVVSTGRSFAFYRKVFFENKSENQVLEKLQGQVVLDIGCGLTPYVSNSMFQACHEAGVDFYGIDPKLANGFKLGAFDWAKTLVTGGGALNENAPGLEKGIGALADDLPFEDNSVDLILSSFVIFAWIENELILENIFREFHRVLKPGASIKVFPAPYYKEEKIASAGLKGIMRKFDVEQEFFFGISPVTHFPPSYMRKFIKKKVSD